MNVLQNQFSASSKDLVNSKPFLSRIHSHPMSFYVGNNGRKAAKQGLKSCSDQSVSGKDTHVGGKHSIVAEI